MIHTRLRICLTAIALSFGTMAAEANHEQFSSKQNVIIYLNGPSSSGKSTIAHALQEALEEPYLLIGIDKVIEMMPPKLNNWKGGPAPLGYSWQAACDEEGHPIKTLAIGPYAKKMEPLLKAMVRTIIEQDHNVIVDDIVFGKSAVDEWREAFKGFRVLWVGISAPLAVLEERERQRPDRMIGSAKVLAALVNKDVIYDLEFDTSKSSLSEIVTIIKTKTQLLTSDLP